ncbi:universal stress protein [Paenibacillus alkalitolerans]|uniref:universal stress protein n=1 Tax=Paenibacillus alkalitolerans TaxID=2799335 RepID=UPI0018F3D8EB|nr:universal stress protein [Paenibacillus alkalitolerans]
MFEKILLATDGSSHANRAAEAAIRLSKELNNTTVTILHVSASAPKRSELLLADFDVKAVLLEEAHRAIIKTKVRFREEGIPFQLQVALGDPAEEIVKTAADRDFGLIIVGSRGLNRLNEVLLGSVSHKVAHEARCPVMIVK